MTSYNSVINADAYREDAPQRAAADRGAAHPPRRHPRARRHACSRARCTTTPSLYSRRYTRRRARSSRTPSATTSCASAASGLERERNDELTGKRSELTSIIDELRGRQRVGDSLVTNLDPGAQRVAIAALQGRKGSVVAIEPATGKVRVMVSHAGL